MRSIHSIKIKKLTMYNKKIKKFLKKNQHNSGFTLTELLVGLFMSIFVTGALGFGLYQIMSATAREKAKTDARNEASRAVEFISDELRRASAIEPGIPSGSTFSAAAGQTVVLALEIPGQNDSIIYYLENSSGNWQGPQVLYRWGPPLDGNGQYTDNNWQNEALIDGIDDTTVADSSGICDAGDSLTPATPKGFYACVNNNRTAAQIFLTGGIDTDNIAGNDSNYTAQTQAVARAKDVNVNNAEATPNAANTVRSLEADMICNPPNESWTMRMDFDTDPYDGNIDNAVRWIHEEGRQFQPIEIGLNDLNIYSSPIENPSCLSIGNPGATAADNLSTLTTNVSYSIEFQESLGDNPPRPDNSNFWKTFNGDNSDNNYNNPNVDPSGKVIVLKNGSVLDPNVTEIDTTSTVAAAPLYGGYDYDGDPNTESRPSLGDFLVAKGLAVAEGDSFVISGLEPDQRIIAFEIGQDDNGFGENDTNGNNEAHPGFDLQDNVIVMRHDVFDDDHGD